jgi:NAD(P)-dependent dehydrogenase (short-subunit alcohol dehydrogenase family)
MQILDVNIKSAALLVKEAYPYLQKSLNGSVVLVSSIGGLVPFAVSLDVANPLYCSPSPGPSYENC